MMCRRDSLGSVQEDTEKRSGSLEVHLSLPSNQEEEKWQIDARRLVVEQVECDA